MIGTLNYQEGIFLGKEELERSQSFLRNLMKDGIMKGNVDGGLFSGLSFVNDLEFFIKDSMLNLRLRNLEDDLVIGIDREKNPIVLPGTLNCNLNGTSEMGRIDVYIGAATHNWERGVVTIVNQSGVVYAQNDGTIDFTEVFRNSAKGRYSRFRTENGDVYTVQNVQDRYIVFLVETDAVSYEGKIEVMPTLSTFYKESDSEPLYLYDFSQLYAAESTSRFKIATVNWDAEEISEISWDTSSQIL